MQRTNLFLGFTLMIAAVLLLAGCGGADRDDEQPTDSGMAVPESATTPPTTPTSSDDEATTTLPQASDAGREQYIRFSVGAFCYAYGGEIIQGFEDEQGDEFARQYGYNSLREAQEASANYPDIEQEYLRGIQEECPEAYEMIIGWAEEFSDTE